MSQIIETPLVQHIIGLTQRDRTFVQSIDNKAIIENNAIRRRTFRWFVLQRHGRFAKPTESFC